MAHHHLAYGSLIVQSLIMKNLNIILSIILVIFLTFIIFFTINLFLTIIPSKPKTLHDATVFFNTTNYFGAYFSHDGEELLLTSDETGVFNVYSMPVMGGKAEQLTDSKTHAQFAVSWFPYDKRFLYLVDRDGDELDHLYVFENTGIVRDLTPGENLKAQFCGWSGDKNYFWVLTNERNSKNFDLYRYATDSYQRELVLVNNEGWAEFKISRDGRWIALAKIHDNKNSDLYLWESDFANQSGIEQSDITKLKLITSHRGDVNYSLLSFGPDSKQLYYLTDQYGEFKQAWRYDIDTGEHHAVVIADWDVSFLDFSNTGRYRVTSINRDGRTETQFFDTQSATMLELPEIPAGNLTEVTFSPDDTKMAFYLNSSTSPYNIHLVDISTGGHRQLTRALNPKLRSQQLVAGRVIRYSSFDDLKIPAVVYKPLNASAENPVPALIWIHGGPGGQSRLTYSPIIQHLVYHDYAVLAVNNRGSTGYGKTFSHLDDQKQGDVDLKDCIYGKQYLTKLPWINPRQIGIMGESYGGFLVTAALAFAPTQFEVGINIFGVTNWIRTLQSIPAYWESERQELYTEIGDPIADVNRLRAISPLFHAHRIKKPLLVVQGANDPRVLQIESDELVAALRRQGVPVEYLLFTDEGHGFQKRENRIKASNTYVEFLNRYLKK
jgi:dipeptidyl aminopeptidase/acylaminoacyl peptidase